MRNFLLTVILVLLGAQQCHAYLSHTKNVIPQPGAQFNSQNQDFDRKEDSDRFKETICKSTFVNTGCLGPTAVGLTHTPTACLAYAGGYRVTETGSITYPDASLCWVIFDKTGSGGLTSTVTWTRVVNTHYLYWCGTPQPTLPTDTGWLMAVTTSGGAIVNVADLRDTTLPGCAGGGIQCSDVLPGGSCDICSTVLTCFAATTTTTTTTLPPIQDGTCVRLRSLTAASDHIGFWNNFATTAIPVTAIGCRCFGVCAAMATFQLENGLGTPLTLDSPLVCQPNDEAVYVGVTPSIDRLIAAGESLQFSVTNGSDPDPTLQYLLCVRFN